MERNEELNKMLIRFYNVQAGTSIRTSNEANQNVIDEMLEIVKGSVHDVKDFIRRWTYENAEEARGLRGLSECLDALRKEHRDAQAKVEEQNRVTEQSVTSSLGILEKAVVDMISKMQAEKIEANIMGSVEDKVRNFIKDEYGTIERKITTVVDGKSVPMQGVQHEKFETVLKFVANNEPVFLTGPAGSGKNHLCKQVAEALGLKFYFTNAVTQEYKITGFTDAMGTYQPTQFYKAFTEGGLFMLDEMDASIPEVLVILNAAIANRYFDFPAPIGYKEAHPDFRVIAAGNTVGQGASCEYVGRNQLDAASLDRFALIQIDYSEAIENNSALGNIELADFCREYRKSAIKSGQQVIVSYRAIGRLAKMIQIMSLEEALQTCLIKGTERDDLNIICNGIDRDSKFKTALKNVIRQMKVA